MTVHFFKWGDIEFTKFNWFNYKPFNVVLHFAGDGLYAKHFMCVWIMTSSFCHNGKKNSNVYTERSFDVNPTKVSLNLFQDRDFIFFLFFDQTTPRDIYRSKEMSRQRISLKFVYYSLGLLNYCYFIAWFVSI